MTITQEQAQNWLNTVWEERIVIALYGKSMLAQKPTVEQVIESAKTCAAEMRTAYRRMARMIRLQGYLYR